ncbi:hypothetical protein TIFTF001_032053 [Ficus carica]|uniref:Uncharacterized protein n=1 Tax=Ficus carica TaxID=3494 RepID=A0AA88J574_FICCA|nr:hypothetical protein TIFTF001_032053 [Ficus carica]
MSISEAWTSGGSCTDDDPSDWDPEDAKAPETVLRGSMGPSPSHALDAYVGPTANCRPH